jgi:trimethylamine--corrinoid protein Co-methyltransferase
MVLIQLACPGAPVFHSVYVSLMDPRTGGYIGHGPAPLSKMAVELAHAWGVPSLGGASLSSDADYIGWESGTDAGFGAANVSSYGGEVCGYLGLVGGSMILYPEQLILEHEVCLSAYEMLHGFEFHEADMALDVIAAVGPGSHFLRQRHTRKRIRDFRLSRIFRQKDSDNNWRDPREVALEEFKRIHTTHRPQPLSQPVLSELDRILAAAEREAEGVTG